MGAAKGLRGWARPRAAARAVAAMRRAPLMSRSRIGYRPIAADHLHRILFHSSVAIGGRAMPPRPIAANSSFAEFRALSRVSLAVGDQSGLPGRQFVGAADGNADAADQNQDVAAGFSFNAFDRTLRHPPGAVDLHPGGA
ncbi:hypothetical protein D3C80_932410 [compost metagenome]